MRIGATVRFGRGGIKSVCHKCDVPLFVDKSAKGKKVICYPCHSTLHEKECIDCGVMFRTFNARRCYPCSKHRWKFMDRERSAANSEVAKARSRGALADPRTLPCTDCGAQASEYDHRDYSKPLEVDPVCRRCNARRGPGKRAVAYEPRRLEAAAGPIAADE